MLNKDSKNYKLFNWIVPIGVILIFVLIEFIVRIFVPPAISSEIDLGPLSMFEKIEKEDGTWHRIIGKYNITNSQFEFKEIPDPDVYRIIVLGGSAAAGWPHPSDQTFSSYLEKTLNKINTNKKTEVINCSAHGFASYRVLQVFRQVIKWHPDLVIVWSGNNEFLEKRRVNDNPTIHLIRKIGLKIRIVQVVSKMLFPPVELGNNINDAETFWKKTRQESIDLRTDEKKFANVRKTYSKSIGEIVKKAKDENIQLLLMTVPVNLRDWQPNVSVLEGTENDSLKWRQHYVSGRGKSIQKNIDGAIEELKLATDIQPKHADTWFWLAKAYEQTGDSLNAYSCYSRARDLDMNPFRALSSFNDSIRILSKRHNVALFDAELVFRRFSKGGIPGFDRFIDYVHPSKNGNTILCIYAAEQISHNAQFNGGKKLTIGPEILRLFQDGYYDEYDINLRLKRFSLCCITHQDKSVVLFGNQLLETVATDISDDPNVERIISKIEAGVRAFQAKIEADSIEFVNGSISDREREMVKRKLNDFFDTYYPYGTY